VKYLLDTCVISELVKPAPNIQVTNWLNAATASTHNLILVTRNECDFTPGQIPLINPWEIKNQEREDRQKKATKKP